jgi:polyphenol oxidase
MTLDDFPEVRIALSEKKDGSMRLSGSKTTEENRRRFLKKKGINPDQTVFAELVHGNRIVWTDSSFKGKAIPRADGLITKDSNLFLCLTIADCLPVFLFDKQKKAVGIVHAGWRGLVGGVIREAVEKMDSSSKDNVLAKIGPGICPEHFEIKEDVLKKLKKYPESVVRKSDKIFFDLKKAAKNILQEAGVAESNIEADKDCTFCLKHKYFSYRRDGKKTKTMMAAIGLTQRSG